MKYLKKVWFILSSSYKRKSIVLFFLILISTFLEVLGIGLVVPFILFLLEDNILVKYTFLTSILGYFYSDPGKIELIKNPDILSSISNESLIKVVFAAETENLIENAQKKIINKNLNLIIGNDVSRNDIGFNSEDNEVIIINKSGEVENLPKMTKYELAHEILDRVQALLN